MKTLADLKKYLQIGTVIRMSFSCFPSNVKVGKSREVVKVQSNGVYFVDPDSPTADEYRKTGQGAFLDFPKASLLEITKEGFTIYNPGLRLLTDKEQEILANQPHDEEQDRIDMLTDGNHMFRRRKAYFKESGYFYLFGTGKYNGKYYTKGQIRDDAVKGDIALQYVFITKPGS